MRDAEMQMGGGEKVINSSKHHARGVGIGRLRVKAKLIESPTLREHPQQAPSTHSGNDHCFRPVASPRISRLCLREHPRAAGRGCGWS